MQTKRHLWKSTLVLTLAALSLVACGAKEGEEGGACKPDGTCLEGLKCVNNVCEADTSTGGGLFSKIYASTSFQQCKNCHAPNAAGRDPETTELNLDWSTQAQAYSTTKNKTASVPASNSQKDGCNGVPFIAATPEKSLIVAVFDETIRASFSVTGNTNCVPDEIPDMTLQLINQADLTATEKTNLKTWITNGAPEN